MTSTLKYSLTTMSIRNANKGLFFFPSRYNPHRGLYFTAL